MPKELIIGVIVILLLVLVTPRSLTNPDIFRHGYFDSNGTTWIHPKALRAYNRAARLGNASAGYAQEARDIIQNAQNIIAEHTNVSQDYQIIFNSGASEGNNLIIRSVAFAPWGVKPHIILSSIEHKTSLDCAKKLANAGHIELSLVKPDIDSRIDPINVAKEIKPTTRLVSIMSCNNETGALMDLKTIGSICRESGVLFHSDVVQSFGKTKIPVPELGLDAITFSAHKLYGPQGVGGMVLSGRMADAIDTGCMCIAGSQFNGLRGGTQNIPGIAAFSAAMKETFYKRGEKNQRLLDLKTQFVRDMSQSFPLIPYDRYAGRGENYGFGENGSKQVGMVILGPTVWGEPDPATTSPNTILFSLIRTEPHNKNDRICNIILKKYLADRGFHISIGSACNTSNSEPSHVLESIRAPFIIRSGVVRVSMHDKTTPGEVRTLVRLIRSGIQEQLKFIS